jgi:hypothetical protein
MGATEFLKAVAKLQAFRSNLPEWDIDEEFVAEYHNILVSLEQETGEQFFADFNIPDARMERQVSSYTQPNRFNRFQGTTRYRDKRSCDRNFFLMRLDAAINYFNSLVPVKGKNPIGF